jgi:hypothetical protein
MESKEITIPEEVLNNWKETARAKYSDEKAAAGYLEGRLDQYLQNQKVTREIIGSAMDLNCNILGEASVPSKRYIAFTKRVLNSLFPHQSKTEI